MGAFANQLLIAILAAAKKAVPAFMPESTVAAYSVARRVNPDYSGSLIRVRRSSDDAELDIGFDAQGNLDESALLAFVGLGDGFIHSIYEQSEVVSAVDFLQTDLARQPYIVQSGVVAKANGRPTILQTSTTILDQRFMTLALWNTRPANATVCIVGSNNDNERTRRQMLLSTTNIAVYSGILDPDSESTLLASDSGSPSYYANGVFIAQTGVGTRVDLAQGFMNKGLQVQRHQELVMTSVSWTNLRTFRSAGESSLNGNYELSEMFILSAPHAQDISDLETNQAAYYGITML